MNTTQQTAAMPTAASPGRKLLAASWVVHGPVAVQISATRARKLVENYEATRDGGTVDHQRLLGLRAWPRYRGHLTHLRKEVGC